MNGLHLIQYLKEASYPVTGTPLVAFLGDSVTHGAFECLQGAGENCNFDFDAVYHAVLARELRRINNWLPVSILNAGVAGDSAKCALSRIDRDVIARRPDLCVVNFALNDVNDPLEVYRASLGEVFDRLDYTDPEDDEELRYKLLGEWTYEQFSYIPREREGFRYHRLDVRISDMRQKRIVKLIVRLLPEEPDEAAAAEAAPEKGGEPA